MVSHGPPLCFLFRCRTKCAMNRILAIAILCCCFLNAGQVLMVAHKQADSVGLYDAETGKRLSLIPAGTKPHEFVLTPNYRIAYVTNYGVDRYSETAPGANTITIIDLKTRAKTGEISLGKFHRPHGIQRGASGRLYVTTDFPPSLLVVDPSSQRIIRGYGITGQRLPHMTVVLRNETVAYTSNTGTGTVTAIRLDKQQPPVHIFVGGEPMGLALSKDEGKLFAATRTGNTVVVVGTKEGRVIGKVEVPGSPTRLLLLPDGKYLLVSLIDAGELAVLDTDTLRVIHRMPAGSNVEGMTIDPERRFGYISAQGDNMVVKFLLNNWEPVLRIATEARPDPLAVIPALPQ